MRSAYVINRPDDVYCFESLLMTQIASANKESWLRNEMPIVIEWRLQDGITRSNTL
jgi:hypothetical protein